MIRETEVQEKQTGLHCENRLESLINTISRETSILLSASEDITSNNFLESLPRIKTQTLANAQTLHHEIDSELTEN